MPNHLSPTKTQVCLQERTVDFQFNDVPCIWLADTIKTHFMHSLSLFIPTSERAVIEILRKQLKQTNAPETQHLIHALIKQEGQHAAMHRRANRRILTQHPELKWIDSLHNFFMKWVRKFSSHGFELAIPVGFEHITAATSKHVLTHKNDWFKKHSNNQATDFLLWHCLEELEHQAVCLSIYRTVYPNTTLNNWRIILSLFLVWLPVTCFSVFTIQFYLLLKDKTLLSLGNWPKFLMFMGRTTGLFYKGLFTYRKNKHSAWSQKDITLYKTACDEFNQRQVDSQLKTPS